MQGPREAQSPTRPTGYTQNHVSPNTPARPRFRRRSLSDIKHSSCCEIKLQIAESCSDRPSCSRNLSAEPAGPLAATAVEGSSTLLDTDADHGIELQEQGHAEMLERALGTPVYPYILTVKDVGMSCRRDACWLKFLLLIRIKGVHMFVCVRACSDVSVCWFVCFFSVYHMQRVVG